MSQAVTACGNCSVDLPDVSPANLDDLRHDGWLAVIHADGNGVGRVFTTFAECALRVAGTDGDGLAGLEP